MDLILAIVLGAAVGLVTGLVPGLHVNTIAAIAIALGLAGLAPLAALVAVATVHSFVNILPATYLGAPGEDTAFSVLPAHRMLLEGRGPEAVEITLQSGLLATLLVLALLLPLKWLLEEPGRLLPHVDRLAPFILGAVLLVLLFQEAVIAASRLMWGIVAQVLAGALGLVSTHLTVAGQLPGGSILLPLLGGLFGGAGLVASMMTPPVIPVAQRGGPSSLYLGSTLRGALAALVTSVLPGLTAAVATAVARLGSRDRDPRPVLATLGAVNTAHALLSLWFLWITLRTRSGLAAAAHVFVPVTTWDGPMPEALRVTVLAALGASLLGALLTWALDRAYRHVATRIPARTLAALVLLLLGAATWSLTGTTGCLLFVAATAAGLVPIVAGVRRAHGAACLIVPILW